MLLSLTFTIYTHAVNLRCYMHTCTDNYKYAYMNRQFTNFCLLLIGEAQSHCVSACFTSRFQLLYMDEEIPGRMLVRGWKIQGAHTCLSQTWPAVHGCSAFFCIFNFFFFLFVFWGFFLCVPQLYLWGSPLLGEIFAYVTVFFLNPTIKVVTFCLRGWCVLGVFLLPAFTRLGHERQDLLSPCDEMHVCTD